MCSCRACVRVAASLEPCVMVMSQMRSLVVSVRVRTGWLQTCLLTSHDKVCRHSTGMQPHITNRGDVQCVVGADSLPGHTASRFSVWAKPLCTLLKKRRRLVCLGL